MQDIESVREAMQYDQINIYGTSYGTRVALQYINKYPKHVRTATLKGLVPNDLIIPYHFDWDAQRSLDLLIEACEKNDSCKSTFPDFRNQVQKVLEASPKDIEMENPKNGKPEQITLTRDLMAMTMRSLLASPSATQQMPYLISQAVSGDYAPLAGIILRLQQSYVENIYTGLMLSVICHEDYPLLLGLPTKKGQTSFLENHWNQRVISACNVWNSDTLHIPLSEHKTSKLPVLLISGGRDSATPPHYGEQVLAHFPNGRHIIVPQAGHSFDRMMGCIELMINDYVISGSNKNLNVDCVNEITFPSFRFR